MIIVFKSIENRDDVEFACRLLASQGGATHFRGGNLLTFVAKFDERLARFYHTFFLVVNSDTQERVGVACSWNYYPYDLNCKVDVFLKEEESNEMFAETLLFWVQKLFREYPLRRVFFETIADLQRCEAAVSIGFKREVTLKEYRFVDGAYKDAAILSFTPFSSTDSVS